MSDRDRMIQTIEAETRKTGLTSLNPAVLDAMRRVDRSAFVPDDAKPEAWANQPQSIGHRQTISQPFIVALMTDLVDVRPGDRVLEVGTGSGYQAAVLAALGAQVFSIEVIPALAETARRALDAQGYRSVATRVGDGALGWPEEAPFDAIVVTAAAPAVPPALIEQLRPGGRMAIPIGYPGRSQSLILVEKGMDGRVESQTILPVMFVPLTQPI